MAIDTAEKRKSISGIHSVISPGVTPNSAKDAEWRKEVGHSYSGIATAAPVVVTVQLFPLPNIRRDIEQATERLLTVVGCRNIHLGALPPLTTMEQLFEVGRIESQVGQPQFEIWSVLRPSIAILTPGSETRYTTLHSIQIQSLVWHGDYITSRRYVHARTEEALRTFEKNKFLSLRVGEAEVLNLTAEFDFQTFGQIFLYGSLITFDLSLDMIEARGRITA